MKHSATRSTASQYRLLLILSVWTMSVETVCCRQRRPIVLSAGDRDDGEIVAWSDASAGNQLIWCAPARHNYCYQTISNCLAPRVLPWPMDWIIMDDLWECRFVCLHTACRKLSLSLSVCLSPSLRRFTVDEQRQPTPLPPQNILPHVLTLEDILPAYEHKK